MKLKQKIVLSYILAIFFWVGIALLPTLLYAYCSGKYLNLFLHLELVLLSAGIINVLLSLGRIFFQALGKKPILPEPAKLDIKILWEGQTEVIMVLLWIILPIFLSLPFYVFSGDALSSLFESFSALTTSGFTTFSELPEVLIFYRAELSWIGGVGFLAFALTILKGVLGKNLAKILGIMYEQDATKKILTTYILITFVAWTILYLSGFSPLSALIHAFTSISNAGFLSEKNLNESKILALTITQYLGALSFPIYVYFIYNRKIKLFDLPLYLLWCFVLTYVLSSFTGWTLEEALINLTPALTTGGFQFKIAETSLAKLIYIVAMFVGGMQISSAGGLKFSKMIYGFFGVIHVLKGKFKSEKIKKILRVYGTPITTNDILRLFAYLYTYFLTYLTSTFLLAFYFPLDDALFLSASALSNSGLTTINIQALPEAVKAFLILVMLLGRLEILPIITAIVFLLLRR